MASAIQIDTLAFSKRLREAGADEQLAEAIVEGITAADTSELTTKSDLAEVKTELKQDIAEVKTELKQDISDVRNEIAVVRTEIAQLATGLYRQMWIMGVGIVGLVFTLGKLFP